MSHSIRRGDPDDLVDVMRLFDGALLETDANRVRARLVGERGSLLVSTTEGRLVGAIAVLTADETSEELVWPDSVYISAIAVQKARRGRGIGQSLIEAAAEWAGPRSLSATFDERVQPFYAACGFEIVRREGRLWGRRPPVD